jgi:hypothetical protein
MPRHCRFAAPVALLACILTLFSLGATFLHAETSASLAPVSLLVDEKTAAPDSGATSVSSPTETAPAPASGYGGPFGERLKLTGDRFGVRAHGVLLSGTVIRGLRDSRSRTFKPTMTRRSSKTRRTNANSSVLKSQEKENTDKRM